MSSAICLIGGECDLQGAGGTTPLGQIVITTIAAGSVALVVSVWNDAIKKYLKSTLSGLLAATVLLIAALAVPSLVLAGLATGVLLLAAMLRKWIWGKNLRFGQNILVPLPRLILPVASAVYLVGAAAILLVAQLKPLPPQSVKTVAFFAPSKLIGTSLEDIVLANEVGLLSKIDLSSKKLISSTFADLDIEFHPTFLPDQHLEFRGSFGQTNVAKLDYWLSQDEKLNRLSKEVDIALEESAKIQSASGNIRELVVRAYVNRRTPEEGGFHRVSSGNSIVAHGTVANSNELMLVLAVRIAAKLLNELNLPPLTPEQQNLVWSDFSQVLRDQIAVFLDFNGNDPPTDAEVQAREAMAAAEVCETADCAMIIAAAFEDLLIPTTGDVTRLSTASAAYEAALGK